MGNFQGIFMLLPEKVSCQVGRPDKKTHDSLAHVHPIKRLQAQKTRATET